MPKLKKKYIILLALLTSLLILKLYFENDNFKYMSMTMWPAKPKSSVEQKILKQDGYDVHYFVSGCTDGELIVFLHPAFSSHTVFDFQIDAFSEKYRVITMDMIGHGLSQRGKSKDQIDVTPWHISEIMQAEGYSKAHLVGVSLGSLLAQYFALNHPERVWSLTALGGYDINKESAEVKEAQKSSNFGLVLRALFSINSFRAKTAELSTSTPQGNQLFYISSENFRRSSFPAMQGLTNIVKNRDFSPQYPTLIMTGEYDIPLAIKISENWHAYLPNSRYEVIKDAGHTANADNPTQFNSIVLDFISQIDNSK